MPADTPPRSSGPGGASIDANEKICGDVSGPAVGSAAIAAALIFAGRHKNTFVDAGPERSIDPLRRPITEG